MGGGAKIHLIFFLFQVLGNFSRKKKESRIFLKTHPLYLFLTIIFFLKSFGNN